MNNPQELQAHAERIRASQVLGRSELMNRLFDFFVECSLNGKIPKEIEIAVDVFGKDARFEVTQDAMVRVYVHKLRRKLQDYYAGPGRSEVGRLAIPRGEYTLLYEATPVVSLQDTADEIAGAIDDNQDEVVAETAQPMLATSRTRWLPMALAAGALLAINVALWWFFAGASPQSELSAVRTSPLWRDIVADDQPVTIVLGDYYIFGELDAPSETNPESVRRLVREFNINSRSDFDHWLKERPELADRYMDLALRYLPVSSAYALTDVVPLVRSRNRRSVQIVLASDLTPAMIRSSHVVYIGLISGMGILRDIVFAGSQFKIGDTYDELIDQKHDKIYVSQSSIAINDGTRYRDYGYFSTFSGPNGKRVIVLAGTRDVAVMHTAEAASSAESVELLLRQAGSTANFEALYAVDAIDHMNLDGQLLLTHALDTQRIWSGSTAIAALSSAAF